MNRTITTILALVLLVALFFGINILAGQGLRSARLDLTENKLFTLAEGSRRIARSAEEPIRLTYYWSQSITRKSPGLQQWGQRVRELLEEFQRQSGGKIRLEIVDPEPFSDAEDQAKLAGLSSITIGPGENLFLGLVGANSVDGREMIPYFDPENERLLEYDVAKLVYALANPKKKTIGVLAQVPVNGGMSFDPRTRQPAQSPAWYVMREMRAFYDVKEIQPDQTTLPDGLDVLMVIHPKKVSDEMLFAIDQFVLKGGRVMVFVDPLCEAEVPPGNQMQAMMADRSSSFSRLFDAWGVEMLTGKIAGDMKLAIPVNTQASRGEPVPYVAWLALGRADDVQCLNQSDAVTSRLSRVFLSSAGVLRQKKAEGQAASTVTFTPLIETTTESAILDVSQVSMMPDPKTLLANMVVSGEKLVLGARLSGPARTAFPDGKPTPPPPAEGAGPTPPAAGSGEGIKESAGPINVLVFSDVDMLSDRNWVRMQDIGLGMPLVQKIFDNGDLVINAADNMVGSADLISVRARGEYTRPFDKVVDLQRAAQKKYLAEEQELQRKLDETERKITEMQQKRPDGSDALVLTPEQRKEIEAFRVQASDTRKQLRNVQLSLRKDIDKLFTALKVANIAIVPLAVTLLAVGLGVYRSARRASARRKQA